MGLIHKKILGVKITFSRKDVILKEIEKYLLKNKKQKTKNKNYNVEPMVIFTPNPEIINFAQKDNNFKEVVNSSQINLPDGSGVVWAVDKIFRDKIEKISGSDFVWDLTEFAAKKGLTIGLIGGRNGVALEVRECLMKKYPKLKIVMLGEPEIETSNFKYQISNKIQNHHFKSQQWSNRTMKQSRNGPINQIAYETARKITKSRISILFVAMGFPKQEYFIEEVNRQLSIVNCQNPLVLMAVGGTFDYISGKIPRAPLLMRSMGFEWLYRLISEPQRLGRQIRGAEFFGKVITS